MAITTSLAKATWRDYLELCKPRVVLLMLLCATVGMFLSVQGLVPWHVLLFGNLGIALVAGSAAVVNHIVDAEIDMKMARTENRPIAQGRINLRAGIMFSGVIGIIGMIVLVYLVNPLTAWLNLGAWVGYGIVYSIYLKRATPQNIVIGGLFGAAPPLFGWTAVTNSIDGGGLLLVLIIFAWTPPHFWALALDRKDEYAKAAIPMLPITHGEKLTKLYILLYTIILVVVSTFPYSTGMSNLLYLAGALVLGAGFLYWAVELMRGKNAKAAMETFKYSIIYLMALFVVLLLDHYLMPVANTAGNLL
jgi:protoheme IX farnesyltransferase|tara:strand:- start:806 stop:1720 length:915 start_codon:yes stop_codon:yes gene_type:complete